MKKLILMLALVLSIGTLAACGSSKSGSDSGSSKNFTATEAKSLASELASSNVFKDELSEIDAATAANYLGITNDDYSSMIAYRSSGATAEEITIVEVKDGKSIDDKVSTYLENQKNTYKDYNPDEVNKLNNAITEKKGSFYILVVANDKDAAKKIISNY